MDNTELSPFSYIFLRAQTPDAVMGEPSVRKRLTQLRDTMVKKGLITVAAGVFVVVGLGATYPNNSSDPAIVLPSGDKWLGAANSESDLNLERIDVLMLQGTIKMDDRAVSSYWKAASQYELLLQKPGSGDLTQAQVRFQEAGSALMALPGVRSTYALQKQNRDAEQQKSDVLARQAIQDLNTPNPTSSSGPDVDM